MQRVKNITYYDEDDLYSDQEDDYAEEEYSQEDLDNFANLTPVVKSELQEAGLQASDREAQDALWDAYWDVAAAVADLRARKVKAGSEKRAAEAKKAQEKPKSRFDQAAERNASTGGASKPKQTDGKLAKNTEALSLKDDHARLPAQPKVKSMDLDVPKLWEEGAATRKPSAAFVVIGHVDHGKSTLMGRLLLDTGAVSQRDIDKYQKQAAEIGKSSFALAWVMDTGSEERERGVTFDFAQHHFSTDKVDFTILDAPGHRDFVPNMIGGASIADLAVLVVDATQLDSGMKGQTREHIQLARAVGLQRVVVAINKLDSTTPAWNEQAFNDVQATISKFLSETGFDESKITFVPCSGLSGDNVAKAPTSKNASWITGTYSTLLSALESSQHTATSAESIKRPLRMQIIDVFRGSVTNPLSISGRISSGNVQVGNTVTIQPSGETATIRAIEVSDNSRDYAVSGQICTLHLADIEEQHLRAGDLVCSTAQPVQSKNMVSAVVEVLEPLLPEPVEVHLGRLQVAGTVAQLVEVIGQESKKRPRMLKPGQKARVKVKVDGVPVEAGARVVLRREGKTVGFGVVEG